MKRIDGAAGAFGHPLRDRLDPRKVTYMNAITEQQNLFLQLRAQGKTYNDIAYALGVSRRTLFYWNQQLQEEISWEESAELEALQHELLGTRRARAQYLTRRLIAVDEELEKRSLADLSTARLLSLTESLRRQILKETTPSKPKRPSLERLPASQCNDSAKMLRPVAEPDTRENPDSSEAQPAPEIHTLTQITEPQSNTSALSSQPTPESLRTPSLCVENELPNTPTTPQCNDGAIIVQKSAIEAPYL